MPNVNTKASKPNLPLPPPLLSNTPNTWAYDTMSRRVNEDILQRTFDENKKEFTSVEFESALARFNALRKELESAATTPISDLAPKEGDDCDDVEEWNGILQPFVGNKDTWLSAPWMVTEFYLYRRLLQELGYYTPTLPATDDTTTSKPNPTYRYDPFAKQKHAGLVSSVPITEPILTQIDTSVPSTKEGLQVVVSFCLWGNKMDLSIWPTGSDAKNTVGMFGEILDSAKDNLLHSDMEALVDYVCEGEPTRTVDLEDEISDESSSCKKKNVDIIVDNAGFELIMDLVLADFLLQSNFAKTINFQLKSHPTFVSDAMEKDLREHVEYYANLDESEYPSCVAAGKRWMSYLESGQWTCQENNFWVQGIAMWQMTPSLREDLAQRCDLAIVKGDANYRRLLGDLAWDYSASFGDVVGCYFPSPVCALRTLKAEIGCGMEKEQVKRAMDLDDDWLVNGRFGVVQFSL